MRSREDVPLRIAYQGVEGSYSHLAAQRRYARPPGRRAAHRLRHVPRRGGGGAQRAPPISRCCRSRTRRPAASTRPTICSRAAGCTSRARSSARSSTACSRCRASTLDELRVVMSHPQALAQCHDFLAQHPQLVAARRARHRRLGAAGRRRERSHARRDRERRRRQDAMASRSSRTGSRPSAGNATRFVEVGLRPAPVAEAATAKTSLVLALADRPGALGEVLMRFAARGLSLTKLESRPIPDAPFTYRFYVDVHGPRRERAVPRRARRHRAR